MASRRFYRRRFLNRRGFHAGAYVLADCRVSSSHRRDSERAVDAELTIADCSRVTTIDLDAYSLAEARNALHKARLLRTIVDDFADAFEEAVREVHPTLE